MVLSHAETVNYDNTFVFLAFVCVCVCEHVYQVDELVV
jgi:hypothetical protein